MAGIVLFFRWRTMSTKPKVQWKPVLTKLGVDARPGSVDCDGAGQHALTKANEAQRLLDQYYKVQDRVMSAMEAHAANIARLVRRNHSYCEQHEKPALLGRSARSKALRRTDHSRMGRMRRVCRPTDTRSGAATTETVASTIA